MDEPEGLIFYKTPEVTVATNKFIRVPIILQYESTPLIEVVTAHKAGYTIQIPIYHPDGTYLAKAVGSRLFTTPAGDKANLILRYPQKGVTACELDGRTLFEIHRTAAAALNASAELHTPEGAFVKCSHDLTPQLFFQNVQTPLQVGGMTLMNNTFTRLLCFKPVQF